MRSATPLFIFICSLQLTHLTCRLELIMQARVTHVCSSNHSGVIMTHLYKQRVQPHDSYQFFRLEASGYKIIQVVLPVGPSGTTKDTYRIFFEVTIFHHIPLTRRVFYNNINNKKSRYRGHDQHEQGNTYINHWKLFNIMQSSSSIFSLQQHQHFDHFDQQQSLTASISNIFDLSISSNIFSALTF